jgi:hypothetical protein
MQPVASLRLTFSLVVTVLDHNKIIIQEVQMVLSHKAPLFTKYSNIIKTTANLLNLRMKGIR